MDSKLIKVNAIAQRILDGFSGKDIETVTFGAQLAATSMLVMGERDNNSLIEQFETCIDWLKDDAGIELDKEVTPIDTFLVPAEKYERFVDVTHVIYHPIEEAGTFNILIVALFKALSQCYQVLTDEQKPVMEAYLVALCNMIRWNIYLIQNKGMTIPPFQEK